MLSMIIQSMGCFKGAGPEYYHPGSKLKVQHSRTHTWDTNSFPQESPLDTCCVGEHPGLNPLGLVPVSIYHRTSLSPLPSLLECQWLPPLRVGTQSDKGQGLSQRQASCAQAHFLLVQALAGSLEPQTQLSSQLSFLLNVCQNENTYYEVINNLRMLP